MYIEELIGDKEAIILAALTHPGLAPRRNPTLENAMKAVANEVEIKALREVQAAVEPQLQDVYDMYTLMNGEYADAGDSADDYESGLDSEVEKLLEPYADNLSQDWMGKNFIDTRLWEEHAIGKLAQSVGKEVFRQLSYGKTPAQTLASAGIVQADVEIYFAQHLASAPQKEPEKTMAEQSTLDAVISKIVSHIGHGYAPMEVYSDLELALDDDEILSEGAGKRIGLDKADLNVLQMATLEYGDDTADKLFDMIKATPHSSKPGPKANATPKGAPVAGAIDKSVLVALKEHGGAKDADMATALGVSRATYNNYVNGKTEFAPDANQYGVLRDQLVINANGLLAALAALDGSEPLVAS